MSDKKPEQEFIDEKEDDREEREEFDKKKGEGLALELDDSLQDEESNFSPASPVYELNSWREEPDTPIYTPDESLSDDFEPASEAVESDDEPEDPSAEIIQLEDLDNTTISQHRKAYVNYINDNFYESLKDLKKTSSLNIYQLLVKKYLSLNTPYRGLLVYHGLGTGKTATAISLAEGLNGQMRINTLLPASLEGNFIGEIMGDPIKGKMGWGEEINIKNNWKFVGLSDIDDEFKEKYKLDGKVLRSIQNLSVKECDNNSDKKKVKSIRGLYIPDKDGQLYEELDDIHKIFLKQEIFYLIKTKYNFIHYNPFPKVKTTSIEGFKEDDEEDEDLYLLDEKDKKRLLTNNAMIVKDLEKRLKFNKKNFNVESPFYGECVIIDEVHNFVREILNPSSKPSKVFYEWIVNAENVKLVFLSGTPIINKPAEIAVLYNMLKGLIKIYSFTIISDIDTEIVTKKLNDIFYENKLSNIELFYVERNKGKLVISFIQERTNYESFKNPDDKDGIVYTIQSKREGIKSFDEFINEIYKGLHELFKDENITPSKDFYDNLSQSGKNNLLKGKPVIYDKKLNITFNRRQKLFDILEDDIMIDMTDNENFMRYFFEGRVEIPEKKRILMKRMLMGLTSYYPIDRSSIVDMPIVKDPEYISDDFKNHMIVKNMNVVPCMMSQTQFEKYMEMYSKEKAIDAFARMNNYDENSPFHYHMRTRQTCNIVYIDDDFRTTKKTDDNSEEIENLKARSFQKILDDNSLRIDKDLKILSPKMFQIMNNINRFTKESESGKIPTGKILFYSDFRSDGGSEAFELVLKSNGYEKFNHKDPQKEKGKRYTFITGSEGPEERSINKEYFNDEKNKYGEYIQIMIISSAGAEGISLTCVRQVHILEPFWNYVRIDQVLGRAIRMKSHEQLTKQERNVEQYLYICTLPKGTNLESTYKSLKADPYQTWTIPNFEDSEIKTQCSKRENKDFKDILDNIIRVNVDTNGESADNHLFEIMERKYKVSLEINSIIKESSLDCIQHTRDDPELNDKCIRFSDKLSGEIAYFPGISAKVLENIDIVQLKAKYLYHIKPNVYVISASNDQGNNLFIYYEYASNETESGAEGTTKEEVDIRYIREKGRRLCDVYIDSMMILNYVQKEHPYNKRLGKEFSVYQEIYTIKDNIIDEYIGLDKFPSLDKLLIKDSLQGYKLKYNVNDTFYYMGIDSILPEVCIQRIYPYQIYIDENYKTDNIKPRVIFNGNLYIKD
ncbi:MAG: hypothetical protein CMG26_06295 [Candidatus Marinimicrobia bacterium]|nr:hypothetical protein [Candidatus Neomarinimicrobiota bacterium]